MSDLIKDLPYKVFDEYLYPISMNNRASGRIKYRCNYAQKKRHNNLKKLANRNKNKRAKQSRKRNRK